MDKKSLMKTITEKVGRDKAIELVTQAYNTELLTTHLNRLEPTDRKLNTRQRRDHLAEALQRVSDVCALTS